MGVTMADDDVYEEEIELGWSNVLSVWWLITWRTAIGMVVFLLIASVIIGFAGVAVGLDRELVQISGGVFAWIVALVWGFIVMRMALRKRYRSFRIALVA
jgi:hypothetical protein